jgi:hypothetical protein
LDQKEIGENTRFIRGGIKETVRDLAFIQKQQRCKTGRHGRKVAQASRLMNKTIARLPPLSKYYTAGGGTLCFALKEMVRMR